MTFSIRYRRAGGLSTQGHERGSSGIDVARPVVLGHRGQAVFINDAGSSAPDFGLQIVESGKRLHLIGRVRLDGKAELVRRLNVCSQDAGAGLSDHALVLAAYAAWGADFLKHIAGDFCFALWDASRQELLCARDQLGVRPLYYAEVNGDWMISDSLDSVSADLGSGTPLDDYWIADFLATGISTEWHRTAFSRAKRLSPGYLLRISDGASEVKPYWLFSLPEPHSGRLRAHYLAEFDDLVTRAVADRLPTGNVGITLSGGLDSSTLAVTALKLTGDTSKVIADTRYFRTLIEDDEPYFSALVAKKLGIRQRLVDNDDGFYDPIWKASSLSFPEPRTDIVFGPAERAKEACLAREAKVWFHGEGPDNALTFEWRPYVRYLKEKGNWLRLAMALGFLVRDATSSEWRTAAQRLFRGQFPWLPTVVSAVPAWVESRFAMATSLEGRVRTTWPGDTWKPRVSASFTDPIWSHQFESYDPAYSGTPLDWRHPFLDLRVLEFMLAVPPVPWGRDKNLIREAMRNDLPPEVLARPKTPLRADPRAILLRRHPLPPLSAKSPVWQYVNRARLAELGTADADLHDLLRVHVLDHWLTHRGYA